MRQFCGCRFSLMRLFLTLRGAGMLTLSANLTATIHDFLKLAAACWRNYLSE